MSNMNFVQKANQLKIEADEVVKKTDIVSVFEKIGEVIFVGSYELNLLFRYDIDLFVKSEKCSLEIALNTTKQLLDSKLFQTVGFANCSDYHCQNGLPGYYWELIYEHNGRQWKFDVWYTAEKDIKTIEKTKLIKRGLREHPESREKILKLKNEFFDGEKYKNGMNGFKIYESVLGKI